MTQAVASADVCLIVKEEGVISANQVRKKCATFPELCDFPFLIPGRVIPFVSQVRLLDNLISNNSIEFISLCSTDKTAQFIQMMVYLFDPLDECQPMTCHNWDLLDIEFLNLN